MAIAGFIAVTVALWPGSQAEADQATVMRLSRVLAAEEAHAGKASPYLLPVIEHLAQAHLQGGALAKAAALRRRALAIAVAAYGCDSPRAAEQMTALALVDIERSHYLDAEPLLIVAEQVLRPPTTGNDTMRPAVFAGLARIALSRGDAKAAEAWANRAVAAARGNAGGRAAALRMLGAALIAQERFDEAEPVLTEALALDQAQHGADAVATARSLSQLAKLYLRRGSAKTALPLIERAALIDQTRLGPSHPFIAEDFYDLGLVYEALGRTEMARTAFLNAIHTLERGADQDAPLIAYAENELSRLYRQQGEAAAADAALKNARRILDKAAAEQRRREREA